MKYFALSLILKARLLEFGNGQPIDRAWCLCIDISISDKRESWTESGKVLCTCFLSLLFCHWKGFWVLSNDPGKKGSTFFCCGAIRFPHIEIFSFLRRECINLQKGCLRKKMYLNSTFKGCIFVLKHFDQSQELQTMAKKCSQFYMIRTYDFCVT